MLGHLKWTLRQPRYAGLAVTMLVVAIGCIVAGTWQIQRFRESVHANGALRTNAHAAAVPLSTALVPLVGSPRVSSAAIRFRTVTMTGSYLPPSRFLPDQTSGSHQGSAVVVPFRTTDGVILVDRGLVAAAEKGTPARAVAAVPTGTVRITGRLEVASSTDDEAGTLRDGLIASINPVEQSTRLATPTYQAYVVLSAHQPGSTGVVTAPDLSNPAGGAYEWQHFAYIVQWYLFALLALGAPFVMGRSEVREARRRFLGVDPGEEQFDLEAPEDAGPLALPGGPAAAGTLEAGSAELGGAGLGGAGLGGAEAGSAAAVAVRGAGELAVHGEVTAEQWARAVRIADRYGRSLGPDDPTKRPLRRSARPVRRSTVVPGTSATQPHRSHDDFHGAYNDYLWELALADGQMPDVQVAPAATPSPAAPGTRAPAPRDAIEPRVVDVTPVADPPREDEPGEDEPVDGERPPHG